MALWRVLLRRENSLQKEAQHFSTHSMFLWTEGLNHFQTPEVPFCKHNFCVMPCSLYPDTKQKSFLSGTQSYPVKSGLHLDVERDKTWHARWSSHPALLSINSSRVSQDLRGRRLAPCEKTLLSTVTRQRSVC